MRAIVPVPDPDPKFINDWGVAAGTCEAVGTRMVGVASGMRGVSVGGISVGVMGVGWGVAVIT
jgi:hypothetical protein